MLEHRETTADHTEERNARAMAWVRIGRENPWIRTATDPPFSLGSIHHCDDFEELADKLHRGNWCLGQGFALGDVCFLNQVDGGDEWLVIRGSVPFESYTSETTEEYERRKRGDGDPALARLADFLLRVTAATDDQLRSLTYCQPCPTASQNPPRSRRSSTSARRPA